MVDGRMIETFPDEGCLSSPSQDKCPALNFECPDGFVTASISNLTITPCLPLSYEDAEQATRERQISDQNRCPPGYELVDIGEADPEDYGNVGKCIPNNDDGD